ncbi:hypothetical protein EZS27_003025 [termite gut metagenome]|uniref:DUF3109 domain-containing protein n=1 Tax=termite gut metagenome TaxID=433724 RepID=A0A5J4SWK6_9ZZZZ
MIQIGDAIVTLDVFREKFLCDFSVCKGLCCVKGDAGAPVGKEEAVQLEKALPVVWGDLSVAAREVIRKQGICYEDEDGDFVISIVDGKDCVFTCYDAKGYCRCAIEKAYRTGKTNFYKPVSCHLYPIRINGTDSYQALNYHRWEVCKAAVLLGEKENIPVYKFLKEALIRKFGENWYAGLELVAKELEKNNML